MQIKSNFGPQLYASSRLQRGQRSSVGQLRAGILPPFKRVKNFAEKNRICETSELDKAEISEILWRLFHFNVFTNAKCITLNPGDDLIASL